MSSNLIFISSDGKREGYEIFKERINNNSWPIYNKTPQSINIQDFKPVDGFDYAFVFGNEVDGVRDEFIKASKHVLEIPQDGTKHSLNVSVAAGVVLWDFYKKCGLDNT